MVKKKALPGNPSARKSNKGEETDKVEAIKINKTLDACFTAVLYLELLIILVTLSRRPKLADSNLSDVVLFVICTTVVTLGIIAIRSFSNWAAPLLSRTLLKDPPFSDPLKSPKSKEKFTSQFWQASIHVILGVLEINELSKNNFDWLFQPHSVHEPYAWLQPVDDSVRLLYMTQLAIWLVTCFSHKYVEEKHKDYFLMYSHHLVTIALVIGSYVFGYTHIGIVVLFIHDVSDIPIDCLKLANYLKLEDKPGFFIVEMSYTSVMVVWLYMRLYLYPVYVIYWAVFVEVSCLKDSKTMAGGLTSCARYVRDFCEDGVEMDVLSNWPFSSGQCEDWAAAHALVVAPIMFGLLTALFFMHILWYKLLAGIGLKLIVGTNAHQVGREDYEGHSDDEKEEKED